jgi:hypothetical protein
MRVEVMSEKGHEVLGEWDRRQAMLRLQELDKQLQSYLRRGYSAFGAQSGQRLKALHPERDEDVVLIAPMIGG